MNDIAEYLERTKSAVSKLFEAKESYWELMETPKRPFFTCCGDLDSQVNKKAYEKWIEENDAILKERIKRDNEFAFKLFARSTLLGTILQFAFWGIEKYSKNDIVAQNFENIIKPTSKTLKFCIGRKCENIPIGLIIYAGRNQSVHFDDKHYNPVTTRVFELLTNYYSPTFKKWYKSEYYDLDNPKIINYAENITYTLDWHNYDDYEKDLLEMLQK